MLTVMAVMQCMRVSKCCLLCTRRMVTVMAARRHMHVLVFVFGLVQGACSQRRCIMHVCVGVCSCIRRMLTVIAARRCVYVSTCMHTSGACARAVMQDTACMYAIMSMNHDELRMTLSLLQDNPCMCVL